MLHLRRLIIGSRATSFRIVDPPRMDWPREVLAATGMVSDQIELRFVTNVFNAVGMSLN